MFYDYILSNFAMHVDLDENEILYLKSILNTKSVKKNTILLKAGAICKYLFFVNTGMLRMYYENDEGVEHNIIFAPENWWIVDESSFFGKLPASYTISAMENSGLFFFTYSSLKDLLSKFPKFERFFRILAQNGFQIYESRIMDSLSKTAAERYLLFQKRYPKLELRLTQKHIASFLGITPVFLSRLRNRR